MGDARHKIPGGPLRGIRVLDLTRVLAGPWATQLLADYGADVIKVERPGCGDDTRAWGPPWLADATGAVTADSAYFLAANRNKRSLTANLAHPGGVRIIHDLAIRSDVIIENFRVGTLAKFGLDYARLRALNPALILCSISAYGQDGSRADQPGYDAMVQASGGLMSITGEADGPPQKVGVAIADIMAGMYAASAILAALVGRQASGAGQHIDVSLYDCQVAWLANQNMNYLIGGKSPGRLGSAHPNLVPYQAFATADGHLMLAVGNDRQFRACVEVLGLEDLAGESRFATNAARVHSRDELVALIARVFAQQTTDHWLRALAERGVPAGPINTIEEVLSESYATERGFVKAVHHALAGDIPTVANPVRFSSTPVDYRMAPPALGEHTSEILASELGLTEVEIHALEKAGAI